MLEYSPLLQQSSPTPSVSRMQASLITINTLLATAIASPSRRDNSCTSNDQVGVSSGRAAEIREAFSAAKLVPEAIQYIDPKVSLLRDVLR